MRALPKALIALLAACGAQTTTAPPPEHSEPEPTVTTREQMWHHFWDASDAREAVIRGDLDGVKAALANLAKGEHSTEIEESWGEWMAELKAAAKAGSEAKTLPEAATAIAAVGGTCAECHRATSGGPTFGDDHPGYEHRGLKGLPERMARHVYSEEELWLGISGPVHPAWSRGASALMNIEIPKEVTHEGDVANEDKTPTGEGTLAGAKPAAEPAQPAEPTQPAAKPDTAEGGSAITEAGADMDVALEEMRALGKKADATGMPKDKEAVYAEILSRCGTCHNHLGLEIGPQG